LRPRYLAVLAAVSLLTAACASTPQPQASAAPDTKDDLTQSRQIIGTENGVRVEATVFGDVLKEAQNVTVNYEVMNSRSTPVAIAELVPESNFDPETRTITLEIGSEVPGEQFLPRLVVIPPGGRKSFSAAAHVGVLRPNDYAFHTIPNALRVKVNFLGDTKPFEMLIGIPERVVQDAKLANELFPQWVERNEIVVTNTLPMHWQGSSQTAGPEADWAPSRAMSGRGRRH
jgi:hypothetical protein